MEKHKIYAFLEEIRTRLVQDISPLDVNEAYEMVDAVIKEHDFTTKHLTFCLSGFFSKIRFYEMIPNH
ncbi:hypothetical protein SAMN05660841_04224 [Sphingobacterium nematocida]|uniref:Uncharacterized protein n=1 Tax=Sphingobacterium nematocida TaxID=1513896 RepID=A0A1T5GN12_9SPHI|nr:hypothetical protein [Sphingobacterium nematocida]SKC09806.1 hypothetical protein SAMN05660841_04224 [Sphingobacterium nematocida]